MHNASPPEPSSLSIGEVMYVGYHKPYTLYDKVNNFNHNPSETSINIGPLLYRAMESSPGCMADN